MHYRRLRLQPMRASIFLLSILVTLLFCLIPHQWQAYAKGGGGRSGAPVAVSGHFRSDGTYVAPYVRSAPDGNPTNNYGFPGNYNPNTGEITPGDSSKYIERYNRKGGTGAAAPPSESTMRVGASGFAPSLDSSLEQFETRCRIDAAKRLRATHGVNVDWKDHSSLELFEMQTRMDAARRLRATHGVKVDWKDHSSFELFEMQTRLDEAKRR